MASYLTLLVGVLMALSNTAKSAPPKSSPDEWLSYKAMHGKSYSDSRLDEIRRLVFEDNKKRVNEFHASAPEAQMFELELNKFSDWTPMEMARLNGLKMPRNKLTGKPEIPANSPEGQAYLDKILADRSPVPDQLDWRTVPNRVSEVKDQGQCGSCWAFASVGVLEGQEVAHGKTNLTQLSVQNLLDCDELDAGCDGGYPLQALIWVNEEGGIDDEKSYPYEAVNNECRFSKDKVAFTDYSADILPSGDEQLLKKIVAKIGPVAVSIDASSKSFQAYSKGVYINERCRKVHLNHAVLVVGYGTYPNKGDYWIVKNSWGKDWGDKGYILMARNRNNMCGIATLATIAIF